MRYRSLPLLLVTAFTLAAVAPPARAQIVLPVPDPPSVLSLPGGARAAALGNAFVTYADDPDAIFYNPALLSSAEGAAASARRYGEASTLATLSTAAELGPGTLGAGMRYLEVRAGEPSAPPSVLGARSLFRGGFREGTNVAATFGYGISFDDPSPTWLDDVRLGAATHMLIARDGPSRAYGYGFDLGAAAELEWLMVGLAVQNLGPDLGLGGEYPLPRRAVLSAAHESQRLGPLDVVTAATVAARDRDGDRSLVPGLGVELSYWPIRGRTFFARVGARHDPDDVLSPITVGGGFEADAFAIDYAYERAGDLGGAHSVALHWWQ